MPSSELSLNMEAAAAARREEPAEANPASPRPQSLKRSAGLQYAEWAGETLPRFSVLGASKRDLKEGENTNVHNTYTNPPSSDFETRAAGYLDAKGKKTKEAPKAPSPDAAYSVVGISVYRSKANLEHVASKVDSLKQYLQENSKDSIEGIPEHLVITFNFGSREKTSVVMLFKRNFDLNNVESDSAMKAFERAFRKFLAKDAKGKNASLKYLFKVRDAPKAVSKSISVMGGERPVLIGKKLTTTYHQGPGYLEINQDVGSSWIASSLNGVILKAASKICIDTAWTIEAQDEAELPERLLGSTRWHNVDPRSAYIDLDENYNVVDN